MFDTPPEPPAVVQVEPAPAPAPPAPAPPPPKAAETGVKPGPEFSLRFGPSFVSGNTSENEPLPEQMGVPLAFMLDGGYRIDQRFYVGGFWANGFGLVSPRPCPATFECDAPALLANIGGGARYHLVPNRSFDPWLGAGIALVVQGYSGTRVERSDGLCLFGNCSETVKANTVRFGGSALFEGGLDYRISRSVGIGVAAAAFVGKFLTTDTTIRVQDREVGGSGGGVDGGYHLWVLTSGRFVVNMP